MKKSGDSLDVGQVESEKIGVLLSTSLNKLPKEECVSLEEIAALVDGNIDDSEKDRIMGHLASCDRCYEVFLLTSDLKQENVIPMRRAFFSHPIRLAASIIVAVFSLFLVYKIFIGPGLPDKVESKPEVMREAPALMLKEGYEVEKSDKGVEKRIEKSTGEKPAELPGRPAFTGGRDDRIPEKRKGGVIGGIANEDLHKKGPAPAEKKARIKEEIVAGKATAVGVRGKKDAEMKARTRQKESDQDVGQQQVEQENLQNLPRARNVQTGLDTQQGIQLTQDQKKQVQQQQAEQQQIVQQQAEQQQIVQQQAEQQQTAQQLQSAQEQKDVSQQRRAAAGAIREGESAAVQQLNRELSKYSAYIPAEEIGSLFAATVRLAQRFQNEIGDRFGHDEEHEESTAQTIPVKELAPAIITGTGTDAGFILPDIGYFYRKSEPGTSENKFFKLALSGYCDAGGCYGMLKGKIKKGEKNKLLKSWQELRPQLIGIFSEIAAQTITHLSR